MLRCARVTAERTQKTLVTADEEGRRGADGALWLVVLGGAASQNHPLPASGTVSIGRSKDNDVRIDEASISRRHALIHVGSTLSIEDLDSANGTMLRGSRLSPGIHAGEPGAVAHASQ